MTAVIYSGQLLTYDPKPTISSLVCIYMAVKDPGKELQNADTKASIDLKKLYPLSRRLIVRRSFPWIILFMAIVCIFTYLYAYGPQAFRRDNPQTEMVDAFYMMSIWVLSTSFVILVAIVFYYYMRYWFDTYAVEHEHLIVESGVLVKTRTRTPLEKVTNIYIKQDPLDILFCISDLFTESPASGPVISSIEGLSSKHANALQDHLLEFANRVHTKVDSSVAKEVLKAMAPEQERTVNNGTPHKSSSIDDRRPH